MRIVSRSTADASYSDNRPKKMEEKENAACVCAYVCVCAV